MKTSDPIVPDPPQAERSTSAIGVARSAWGARAATVVLSMVGAIGATWPLIIHLGDATLRSADVWLSAWQLNWYHQALLDSSLRWADANIFFPYDNAAAVNDLLWTHALLTLPAAWVSSSVVAHNAAFLAGIVLCGLCAHLLIEELTGAPWAATFGGTLFALTPFRFLHVGHLSVAAAWGLPLFIWALLRHFREPSWARAWIAAGAGLALSLSSLYHPAFLAPLLPLVIWFAARRGPGGRAAWVPVVTSGTVGLAVLVPMLLPFATAMKSFGVPTTGHDLVRYAADLSSLAQRPLYLRDPTANAGIDPEALLYPGASLAVFAVVGALIVAAGMSNLAGLRRRVGIGLLGVGALALVGSIFPLDGIAYRLWSGLTILLIWSAPLLAAAWAITATRAGQAVGASVAIRFGILGAVFSFVLALGPEAYHAGAYVGPAPYRLLTDLTPIYQGTRVPARFGGLVVLFLSVIAAGALMRLQGRQWGRGLVAPVIAIGALMATFAELPRGYELVTVPDLDNPVYAWLGDQPGVFGLLELPEHEPGWGAQRYMLASKQHGKHLVNGVGRITPGLWRQFIDIEPWSDEFFVFIASYFPLRYVVVHDEGLSGETRADLGRQAEDYGWSEVFNAAATRVFTVDRSSGGGSYLDRIYLRTELAPSATLRFSARWVPPDESRDPPSTDAQGPPAGRVLDFFQNAELVTSFEMGSEWTEHEIVVPVELIGPLVEDSWPRSGTLLTWQPRDDDAPEFEIRNLVVERTSR